MKITLAIFLVCFVGHSVIGQKKKDNSILTEKGTIREGGEIKLLKPSNGAVYGHVYLKNAGNVVYVSGQQYEGVQLVIKKIKYEKDRKLKLEIPIVVAGLPKQASVYDLDIEIIAATKKNEIEIIK